MTPTLKEVFSIREGKDIKNLPVGTEIQLLDKSSGSEPGGSWLDSRIKRRFSGRDLEAASDGQDSGYIVSAPWSPSGTKVVTDQNYGKTWRLLDDGLN